MKLLFILFRSIIYVPLFILAFRWIALRTLVFDQYLPVVLLPWTGLAGIILMLAGGTLVLTCVAVFIFRGKGTPAIFDPPTEFVATGPYTYVRNPMYIGGFILLVGFGLYNGSISILILSLLLLGLIHLFVVYVEEPILKKQFGKSYADYKMRVSRWLPRLKNKAK